jgi:DNA-binding response OmpR family regulator
VSAVPLAGEEPGEGASAAPGAGTETILIVEDEEALSDLLEASLESSGYRVLKASDGLAALEQFRAHRSEISLVISDVGLPKMSGDQVYAAMREMDPSVRTILASGYMEPETKAEALNAGVRSFLQKPYEMHSVLTEVRRVLDSR